MPRPGDVPTTQTRFRKTFSLPWLNDVLGSGFAEGGVYLLSGDPGIGKSTLALQTLGDFAAQGLPGLYISSEQTSAEVSNSLRRVWGTPRGRLPETIMDNFWIEDRLADLRVLPEFMREHVLPSYGHYHDIRVIVLDSIQAKGLTSPAASFRALNEFLWLTKPRGITTLLIGHVTKDGKIAGPNALQHNADAVIQLQRAFKLRPMYIPKNRYGPAALEPLVLEMDRRGRIGPCPQAKGGGVRVLGYDGSGNRLAEAQAVVTLPKLGSTAEFNAPYLPKGKIRQLIRTVGSLDEIGLGERTHQVNAYIPERPSYSNKLDLPLSVAVLASYSQMPVPEDALFVGEVDLMRVVRPPDAGYLKALADLVTSDHRPPIRRIYMAESVAREFAEATGERGGRKVCQVVKVVGVADLEEVVGKVWPGLFK